MSSIAILGSARNSGNTAAVLQRLIAGFCCEVVDLQTCSVAPYNYESDYPKGDQFLSVVQRIVSAPVTIIATPVYWYSYSTPMKVFIDRFSDLLTAHRDLGRQLILLCYRLTGQRQGLSER
ncbi:flavodoxin family protein [Verrucomicrobiota bacterium sgz303538]